MHGGIATSGNVITPSPMLAQDWWQPPLSPKGAEIINDDHRYILVTGPKKCGKTISICHKAIKHLYDWDGAHLGVITKRNETARVGVWPDLTELVLERTWQQQTGVLRYHVRPSITETKRRIFSIYNHKGGISRCTLVSVYRASEVEELLKQTRFSMIYINEADQFQETILDAASDQLRMEAFGIPTEAHQLILDCNPPSEGEKHWLWKRFLSEDGKDDRWRRDFRTIRCHLSDNPWLSDREIEDLINRYRNNPRMYARYVEGIWVPTSEGSIFEGSFDELKHVVGERIASKPQSEWPVLIPPRGTTDLFFGWDPGDINHSCTIFTKRIEDGKYVYDILEDLTKMRREVSARMFTRMVISRIEYWTGVLKLRGAEVVHCRHWTDPSAFVYKATGGSTFAKEVYVASGGKIQLRPVRKGPMSVSARLSMMHNLLMDGRIVFSVLAQNVINAMIGLKPGKNTPIAKAPDLIHAFDSMTYGLSGEISKDLGEETEEEGESEYAHVSVRA